MGGGGTRKTSIYSTLTTKVLLGGFRETTKELNKPIIILRVCHKVIILNDNYTTILTMIANVLFDVG